MSEPADRFAHASFLGELLVEPAFPCGPLEPELIERAGSPGFAELLEFPPPESPLRFRAPLLAAACFDASLLGPATGTAGARLRLSPEGPDGEGETWILEADVSVSDPALFAESAADRVRRVWHDDVETIETAEQAAFELFFGSNTHPESPSDAGFQWVDHPDGSAGETPIAELAARIEQARIDGAARAPSAGTPPRPRC